MLLSQHDSYIDALKEAISEWEKADSYAAKCDFMRAIGDIGAEIHHMNKVTGLR
jgi:hypothetical protein|nr:MAG TPA: hypothetical protein [Caudoviricetes sp.]